MHNIGDNLVLPPNQTVVPLIACLTCKRFIFSYILFAQPLPRHQSADIRR